MKLSPFESVKMFRCVADPMIGPKPKLAFMLPDSPGWEAWFNTESGYIYVKTDTGRRHLVPTGNLASIELFKEEEVGKVQDITGARKKKNEQETHV